MMMTRASWDSARAMETICLPAADSRPTSVLGETSECPSRWSSSRVLRTASRRWENPMVASSCPR
ncbi:Uncharacterised protein [Mycobacteroides abscessus]|nr:Uncharacterised protein [Mycobacteroides abscessus]